MIKTKYAWSISGVRIKANKLVVSDVNSRIMGTVPVRTARPQRGSNEQTWVKNPSNRACNEPCRTLVFAELDLRILDPVVWW